MAFLPGERHHNYRHGQRGKRHTTGAYKSWLSMINRCNPSNSDACPAYAGSGVTVCSRWMESFESFYSDMGDRPKGHSIDRIDPAGNYEPGNCRWADPKTQAMNRKSTVITAVRGESLCLRDISKKYGIPNTTVTRRYAQGLRGEDLICTKNRNVYRRGTQSASSKLTEEKVSEIKARILSGEKNKDLSERFGVSGAVISEIRHNKLWTHVPWPGGGE